MAQNVCREVILILTIKFLKWPNPFSTSEEGSLGPAMIRSGW